MMRTLLFVAVLAASTAGVAFAQAPAPPIPATVAGHWEGELVQQGQALPIRFDFVGDAAAPNGRFSAERWAVMDYPLSGLTAEGAHIRFGMGDTALDGTLAGDTLSGAFKGDDGAGTFTLRRTRARPLPYREIAVSFRNGDVVLSGTLAMPTTPGRHPAVVFSHGSGPESRWGTSRYVADRFARAGIAALVYDKRGSGQSGGDWRKAGYEDLARDLLAGMALLAARGDVDSRRIGVLGHSEGGIVTPVAARLAPDRIAFLIAEDAPAQRLRDQDLYRVGKDITAQDWSPDDKAKALADYRLFLDAASGDGPYEAFAAAAARDRDRPWFQYLGLPLKPHWVWDWYAVRAHLDTGTLWPKLRLPVLLVYGEHDQLMPVPETVRRIEDALDATGAPYTALIAPRAEHNLTVRPQPGEPFFWWRQAPGLNDALVAWVARCTAPDGACVTP
ncbi:MAG: prolyl oligopeptidase family serine peptidase [Proteobacteria bacterium]|nr:prolyl oligopeptidase family serine peptidase [Pseudomonadota bacterium]